MSNPTSKDVTLPPWQECARAVENCVATALQVFIYHNEPSGEPGSENFRDQLEAVLTMVSAHETTAPRNLHSDEWWQAELDRCVAVEQMKYRALFTAYVELKNGDPEVTAGLGSDQNGTPKP